MQVFMLRFLWPTLCMYTCTCGPAEQTQSKGSFKLAELCKIILKIKTENFRTIYKLLLDKFTIRRLGGLIDCHLFSVSMKTSGAVIDETLDQKQHVNNFMTSLYISVTLKGASLLEMVRNSFKFLFSQITGAFRGIMLRTHWSDFRCIKTNELFFVKIT